MKKIVELLLCFLHPLAVVLIWIDLLSRTDISSGAKLAWAIFVLIPHVMLRNRGGVEHYGFTTSPLRLNLIVLSVAIKGGYRGTLRLMRAAPRHSRR